MSARPIAIDFRHNGLSYHQVKRDGLITMYRVSNRAGTILGFEVAVLRIRPAGRIGDSVVPERETYPGDEDFGSSAWYYAFDHRTEAEQRFNAAVDGAPFVAGGKT